MGGGLFSAAFLILTNLPPLAPSNLSIVIDSTTSLSLTWRDNSIDETNFELERSNDGITFTSIASLATNTTTYLDKNLTTDQTYYYRVIAINADGETSSNIVSGVPKQPYTEEQIQRNIARIAYIQDSEVIKLGLKYIEKIQTKIDLSAREDLRLALVTVLTTDTTQVLTLSSEAQNLAALCMGHTKLTNASSAEIVKLIEGAQTKHAETAVIEFAKTTKLMPTLEIMSALKSKALNETIREIALATADQETIRYLIGVANTERNFDPLYGLDSPEAVDIVLKNYLDYFNPPPAPTNLTATLTTYNSVQLSWTDNSTNEIHFQIDVAIGETGGFNELAKVNGNTVYYSHQNLDPEKTYRYRIQSWSLTREGVNSNEVSITTPPKPDPMPDPAPEVPALPKSPKEVMSLADLTKRLRVYIDGKPHEESISALITYVKTSPLPLVAVEASNVLNQKFDRPAFDYSPSVTSLGLKAISEISNRAAQEFNDFVLPESLRREYGNTLRRNSTNLQDRFVKDESPK